MKARYRDVIVNPRDISRARSSTLALFSSLDLSESLPPPGQAEVLYLFVQIKEKARKDAAEEQTRGGTKT